MLRIDVICVLHKIEMTHTDLSENVWSRVEEQLNTPREFSHVHGKVLYIRKRQKPTIH